MCYLFTNLRNCLTHLSWQSLTMYATRVLKISGWIVYKWHHYPMNITGVICASVWHYCLTRFLEALKLIGDRQTESNRKSVTTIPCTMLYGADSWIWRDPRIASLTPCRITASRNWYYSRAQPAIFCHNITLSLWFHLFNCLSLSPSFRSMVLRVTNSTLVFTKVTSW